MRIAIAVPFFHPVIGGMEYHAMEMARELKKRGHNVEVLTAGIDHKGNRILPEIDEIGGIVVRRYSVLLRFGNFASLWPGFIKDLGRYDLIHVQNMRHPHTDLALIFGKLIGKKVVISPQSPLHEGTHSRMQDIFIKLYDNLVIPVLFRFYDAIFAHHLLEKEYLARHGAPAGKIEVVNLGASEETFAPQKKGFFKKIRGRNGKILLYVGRLSNMKGLELLVKSFAKVSRKAKDWKLVLVGPDGGELSKLKRIVRELKISSVVFWGAVSEAEVEKATADADLFVLPSPYEPYGLVLIKAMARGVPCIAIDAGGPSEIIQDGKTGALCRYDERELASTLADLFGNEKLRIMMGRNARKHSSLFTVGRMVDAYEAAYEKAMGAN